MGRIGMTLARCWVCLIRLCDSYTCTAAPPRATPRPALSRPVPRPRPRPMPRASPHTRPRLMPYAAPLQVPPHALCWPEPHLTPCLISRHVPPWLMPSPVQCPTLPRAPPHPVPHPPRSLPHREATSPRVLCSSSPHASVLLSFVPPLSVPRPSLCPAPCWVSTRNGVTSSLHRRRNP